MLKNKSLGFYTACMSVVFEIIALILYFANISNAYFADSVNGIVAGCTAGAIIMSIGYLALVQSGKKNNMVEFCRGLLPAGVTFCLFTSFTTFLGTRVYSMAIIYGSSLEANNTAAQSAMLQAVVTLVLYLAAGVVMTISSFSKTEKMEG